MSALLKVGEVAPCIGRPTYERVENPKPCGERSDDDGEGLSGLRLATAAFEKPMSTSATPLIGWTSAARPPHRHPSNRASVECNGRLRSSESGQDRERMSRPRHEIHHCHIPGEGRPRRCRLAARPCNGNLRPSWTLGLDGSRRITDQGLESPDHDGYHHVVVVVEGNVVDAGDRSRCPGRRLPPTGYSSSLAVGPATCTAKTQLADGATKIRYSGTEQARPGQRA